MSRLGAATMVDCEGEVQRETDRAWLFHDGERTVWLPKSQCRWQPGDKTMAVPEWLAYEKDLI